ncbi:MAG: lysine--tRNA ligase [Acidimicrobiales bacterium]
MSDAPYRFDVTHRVSEIVDAHTDLQSGAETDTVVTVAGRLMLRRDQGKLAFGSLQDSSGRIQLFAMAKSTPDFDGFTSLSIGDWIAVTGIVMMTRRGELSVRVDEWVVLAPAGRPFPDKWHGIADPDTRYRQRYVDLWVTEEARQTFVRRSQIVASMRRILHAQDFVEVETPMLHPIPGGALARPFVTHHNALDEDLYLRIAPELYLKRLVVGGMEKVFEVGRVFRNEGMSTRHNPEFTMLELYWAYADHADMMRLTEELVAGIATEVLGTTTIEYDGREVDLSTPWRRATMEELIAEHAGVDVHLDTPIDELRTICERFGVEIKDHYGPGKLILELYEKTCEAELWGPVFVTDYPVEVSPLSREHRERPGYTERFEAIVAGRELCNGFSELTDPLVQRQRFEAQEVERDAGDDEAMVVDEDYLRALEYGLPGTAGLGVGVDRLVMLLTGTTTIRDVVLFPTLKPEQGRSAADDGETVDGRE